MTPKLRDRITVDPTICFGRPCIKGTRIWVSVLIDQLAEGATAQEILQDYPQLAELDLQAALSFAADNVRYREVELP
jgi:uncharacterized protein (DUF433 family)